MIAFVGKKNRLKCEETRLPALSGNSCRQLDLRVEGEYQADWTRRGGLYQPGALSNLALFFNRLRLVSPAKSLGSISPVQMVLAE